MSPTPFTTGNLEKLKEERAAELAALESPATVVSAKTDQPDSNDSAHSDEEQISVEKIMSSSKKELLELIKTDSLDIEKPEKLTLEQLRQSVLECYDWSE